MIMTQTVAGATQVLEYPLQHFLICLHSHQQADNAVAASCFTLQSATRTGASLRLTLSACAAAAAAASRRSEIKLRKSDVDAETLAAAVTILPKTLTDSQRLK